MVLCSVVFNAYRVILLCGCGLLVSSTGQERPSDTSLSHCRRSRSAAVLLFPSRLPLAHRPEPPVCKFCRPWRFMTTTKGKPRLALSFVPARLPGACVRSSIYARDCLIEYIKLLNDAKGGLNPACGADCHNSTRLASSRLRLTGLSLRHPRMRGFR